MVATRPTASTPRGAAGSPKNLRTFLEEVRAAYPNDLREVNREVDPKWEITGLAAALEKRGEFPVLKYNKVKGSDLPVLISLFGNYERCALAMGQPDVWSAIQASAETEADPVATHEVSRDQAPVQEVVLTGDDAKLSVLPITKHIYIEEVELFLFVSTFVM
jgi:UbiD family decarboxylase